MKNIISIAFLLLLGMTTKAQFYIGTGENIHVVNGGLLYTNDNVSGAGSINVNLSTTEAKGSISGVTINAVNGTMKMSGSADQVVAGVRYVDNAINRLFNHNTTSITIDGKVIVSDTLFMNTTGTPLIKMPTGDTLLLSAVVKNGGEFQLNGGVLHLNPSALDYSCTAKVKGDGGTLSTLNIIENRDITFGTFNLSTTATFNLETINNHIVRFANSSAISWAGTQLTINGWQGAFDGTSGTVGKIYFGTSASALTAAQLEKIRFYDGTYYYDATLLSTGELVPAANSITTGSVATTICPGAGATSIPFTYTNEASFGSSTTFTIQLSDASGSFATASTLGTVTGNASGSQTFSYNFTTSNITAGSGYRIRVISDAPAINGSNNGSDITFQQVNLYYLDADGDTYGAAGSSVNDCSQPSGYVSDNTDCNDASSTVHLGATETCNSIDDDCDGSTDEGVQTTYYADADNDTYGNSTVTTAACSAPAGYVSNSTDCNDASASVHPGATETCNTIDDDCDGSTDEGVQTTFYADADNDTYGDLATTTAACSAPAGYVSNSTDCNDASASVHPGATETCNSVDDDCDGSTDEGVQTTFYADADNDTYGDLTVSTSACTAPAGYVTNSSDCNDSNNAINPAATETCNSIDDNCSGTADEGVTTTYYEDNDSDTYGSSTSSVQACSLPAGYVTNNTDCNDNNGSVNPGATELCGNSIDEDCSGSDLTCPTGGPGSALLLTNIGFYGATSPTTSVNLPIGTNSVENPGNGQDRWFKFVAQYNAIRIALTGASTASDDNDINLFDNPAQLGVQLIPVVGENAVSTSALGAALDGGSETLIYDQLVPGQTYYICVRNNNSAPGVCGMVCQYLRGSANDLAVVTSNSNTFTNSCQNFKSVYRYGASSYTIHRWTGATATGSPEFSFDNNIQVGGVTSSFCQLGKFIPANLTNAAVQYTTKVDVVYNLTDAFGNAEVAVGLGVTGGTFTMSPELDLNVRTLDRCPVYKSATAGSIATNRSICGTQRYEWEFTQTLPTPSLPVYELGAVGGSRILSMNQIDGIAAGQTYGVKIRGKHFDGVSNTAYGTSACVRTLGAAGMPTANDDASEITNNNMRAVLYPNPNAGQGFTLNVEGMDGDVVLNVTDATGKLVKTMRYVAEGGFTAQVEFAQALASGLYQVEIMNGTTRHTMRMAVNR